MDPKNVKIQDLNENVG